jgi:hypothetical protein
MRSVTRVCREAYERDGWSPLIALVAVHAIVIFAGIWIGLGLAPMEVLSPELPGLWMLPVLVVACAFWAFLRRRRALHAGASAGLSIAAVGAALRIVYEAGYAWVGEPASPWPRWIGLAAFGIGLVMFAWACLLPGVRRGADA